MANPNWRTLKPADLTASGKALLIKLQEANKVAAGARKLLADEVLKGLTAPDGKAFVVSAKYGGVSIGIVDAKEAKKSSVSLADWIAQQAA